MNLNVAVMVLRTLIGMLLMIAQTYKWISADDAQTLTQALENLWPALLAVCLIAWQIITRWGTVSVKVEPDHANPTKRFAVLPIVNPLTGRVTYK